VHGGSDSNADKRRFRWDLGRERDGMRTPVEIVVKQFKIGALGFRWRE
jgi:hypothetical protein